MGFEAYGKLRNATDRAWTAFVEAAITAFERLAHPEPYGQRLHGIEAPHALCRDRTMGLSSIDTLRMVRPAPSIAP